MKRYIKSSFGFMKAKYEAHWVEPSGNDRTCGGADTVESANNIAQDCAKDIFENPWMTPDNKRVMLESIYVVDINTEEDYTNDKTEEVVNDLISRLNSQLIIPTKKSKVSDTSNESILYVIRDSHGNQLSRPNPDDGELWDRVSSMEARGRTGLSVVVYTGG